MTIQMKYALLTTFAVAICLLSFGQQKLYDFNTNIPANFSSSGDSLSLSAEHAKDGTNSLKWQVTKGVVLAARDLGISGNETGDVKASSAQFFIYSKQVTNDTLVFRFYDKDGTLKREGHMLLNYKGWRDYHRSYRFDYNNGRELPGFALDKMEIVYKPENPATKSTLYLDAFRMVGDIKDRVPGPHMKLDLRHFTGHVDLLKDFLLAPDIEAGPATAKELLDAQAVALYYVRNIPKVESAKLVAAKKFVEACAIRSNADGTISGRGQLFFDLEDEDTLVQVSQYCAYLAEAAIHDGDEDAKNKLLDFTAYLLDQGLAEGGRLFLHLGHYTSTRTFPVGFLESMQLYPPDMKAEVIKMLKWHIGYNKIYKNIIDPDRSIDYMFLRSNFLFELTALTHSTNEWVRDLKCASRYLSLFSEPAPGKQDGMKTDGCYFHHETHYIGYCYALPVYVDRMYSLKGTSYSITPKAFRNIALAFKALFLQSSKGVLLANSLTGRNPFCGFTLTGNSLEKLAEVGGDIEGKPYDTDLAALYNYIFKTNKYPQAKGDYDGFYQFNYAQTGVTHKNNWTAVMKGFTNKLWGAEIYVQENRYGRYQSYGALEVLYDGDSTASGYPAIGGNGWDWNVAPGTTTVHIPFAELQAKQGRADEFNQNSFAGALSLGNNGIFAMDFKERAGKNYTPNNLKFHKSVFSFNNLLVCLGSGISSTNATDTTATNLFQAVSASANPAVYVNSAQAISNGNYTKVLSAASKGVWLVNGQTTGFYIPKGSGNVIVERGQQTTPEETSLTGSLSSTSNFSKAYIDHGTSPLNASYRFVVVPGTAPKQMKKIADNIASGKLFEVLSQTDSLHAVKYIPENLTSYVFFSANNNVNMGYIKSISGKALVGVKEKNDSLIITINNPDLNAVDDAVNGWRSARYDVNIQLNGTWKVIDNPNNATITNNDNSLTAGFSLIDGFSSTILLVHTNTNQNLTLKK
ncbi:polysaccharide lyase family 8 super-sandwich domain-containing protein [Chitinophagaceae bacterium 26-R-25]|nr:polysaccharide lyase family 8 super-sandwich domain-containing protein [Chitinophagaceae bacterium 26-R-25]